MPSCDLQMIGRKILTKNIMGTSIDLQITKEHTELSISSNNQKIFNLWQQFMTNYYRKLVPYCIDENIIDLEEAITRGCVRKWAAVEINCDIEDVPQVNELRKLTINGEYFGFIHTGTAIQFNEVYRQAMDYLRQNNINIDESRPRLNIMHRSYLPEDPLSKEEFWIPIII